MSGRVGVVSRRSDLLVQVAGLVAEVGGEVRTLDPWGGSGGGTVPWEVPAEWPGAAPEGLSASDAWSAASGDLDLLLVDGLDVPDALIAGSEVAAPGVERIVLCRESEQAQATEAARRLRARHVVALPGGMSWLQDRIPRPSPGAPMVGILGTVGGVGATTLAVALAAARSTLLVDLDPDGAGAHLGLGLEGAPGIRWEDLPASPRGALDAESFLGSLPRAGTLPVLSGQVPGSREGAVPSVLATARMHPPGVVLDLGRRDRHGALAAHDRAVLVVPTTVGGVLAAQRMLQRTTAQVVLAVRDTGWIPASDVVAELGSPPFVRVPRLRRAAELAECGQLLSGATGRRLVRLGAALAELTS